MENEHPAGGKYTRSHSTFSDNKATATCFICDESSIRNNPLHNVSTLGLDARVRKCALALHEEKLLAKLRAGDLVAQEAKYHAPCLASLHNKARTIGDKED